MMAALTSLEHTLKHVKFWSLGPQVVSDFLSIVEKPACHRVLFRQVFYIVLVTLRFTRKRFQRSWDYARKPHHEMSSKILRIC